MKLKLPEEGYFVIDTLPELRPYNWVCECGYTEFAEWLNDDDVDKILKTILRLIHKDCGGTLHAIGMRPYAQGGFEAMVYICAKCAKELEEANDYERIVDEKSAE